jgi:hypothetical protein
MAATAETGAEAGAVVGAVSTEQLAVPLEPVCAGPRIPARRKVTTMLIVEGLQREGR